MTMDFSGRHIETIFHPLIFGAACKASYAPHPIEKIIMRGLSLYVRMNFAKKTNDHVMYF
jgi:hypothetical protein